MLTSLTAQDLQSFEEEIAQLYKEGKIRAPVHLRSSLDKSYENNLIEIYKNVKEDDYVMGFWSMHCQCLLKGVPREELKQAILDGNSISLCFWDRYKILCSGIVSSLVGVSIGLAWSLKQQGSKSIVHLHIGDMASQNGSFYEAVKYAWAHLLPWKAYIEDNGVSVMTDTEKTWRLPTRETYEMLQEYYSSGYVKYFKYQNKFPHSGILQRIKF